MLSHHSLKNSLNVINAKPILIGLTFAMTMLLMEVFFEDCLYKWRYTLYRDIEGYEELSNFFHAVKYSHATEII